MKINYYYINTIIGKLTVVEKNNILVYIGLPDCKLDFIKNWCKKQFNNSNLNFIEFPKSNVKTQIEEYFEKKRYHFDVKFELFTTDFRKLSLNAVAKIPYGETKSYSDIARQIGKPKAVRAVGSANATNTLPIIFPCHRVITNNGGLGGYGGGRDMKIKLLDLEGWNK